MIHGVCNWYKEKALSQPTCDSKMRVILWNSRLITLPKSNRSMFGFSTKHIRPFNAYSILSISSVGRAQVRPTPGAWWYSDCPSAQTTGEIYMVLICLRSAPGAWWHVLCCLDGGYESDVCENIIVQIHVHGVSCPVFDFNQWPLQNQMLGSAFLLLRQDTQSLGSLASTQCVDPSLVFVPNKWPLLFRHLGAKLCQIWLPLISPDRDLCS